MPITVSFRVNDPCANCAGKGKDGRGTLYFHGTPLGLAVIAERADIIGLLLQCEARLEAAQGPLGTIAHLACMTGSLRLFSALCQDITLCSTTAYYRPG